MVRNSFKNFTFKSCFAFDVLLLLNFKGYKHTYSKLKHYLHLCFGSKMFLIPINKYTYMVCAKSKSIKKALSNSSN